MLLTVWAGLVSLTSPSTAMTLPKIATADMSSRATPAAVLAVRIDRSTAARGRSAGGLSSARCWVVGEAV